jgi:hypothetical protein
MSIFEKLFSFRSGSQKEESSEYSADFMNDDEDGHAVIDGALTSAVPENEREDLIKKIAEGSVTIPSKYIKYRYPIEMWEILGPEEAEKAQAEWSYLADVITEDHYRFEEYLLKGSKATELYMGYVELHYDGGYPDRDILLALGKNIDKSLETRRYKNSEAALEALKTTVYDELEHVAIKVRNVYIEVYKV